MHTHLGAHFVNSRNETIKCYQLFDKKNDSVAMAIADFRDGKIERFEYSKYHEFQAKDWLAELIKIN